MAKTKTTPRFRPQKPRTEPKSVEWIIDTDSSSVEGEPYDPASAPFPPLSPLSSNSEDVPPSGPIIVFIEEPRVWQCSKCDHPAMKTIEGLRKHYANIHSVVWFKGTQTFREMSAAEKASHDTKRVSWQNTKKKVPTAEQTGAVAIVPQSTPDRHEARVKNVRRQSVQRLPRATFEPRLPIGSPELLGHPMIRRSTQPCLPGRKRSMAATTTSALTDDDTLFGVVSSSASEEGTPARRAKLDQLPPSNTGSSQPVTAIHILAQPAMASASSTGPPPSAQFFLNIDDSDDSDGEALRGLLPYSPGLPREPQASEKTIRYIQKYGSKAALEKVREAVKPRILTEAETFYYRTGYGLIEQTLWIAKNF